MVPIQSHYRALALDLDGTLLDTEGMLSPFTVQVLRTLAGQGLEIAIASGRMTARILPFAKEIGIPLSVIAFNGAETLEGKGADWTSLELRAISDATRDAVFSLCRDGGHFLNVYSQGKLHGYHPQGKFAASKIYSNQTGAEYAGLHDDPGALPHSEIAKLLVVDTPEIRDRLFTTWSPLLGAHCSLVKSNPEYLEIVDVGVNKGSALKSWLGVKGIGQESLIAFGDAENDLEMLKLAALGIAMGNCTPGLLAKYDRVSAWTNSQNGVARELTQIFGLEIG